MSGTPRRRFEDFETETLMRLHGTITLREIAARLGRTVGSVEGKVWQLQAMGLLPSRAKRREAADQPVVAPAPTVSVRQARHSLPPYARNYVPGPQPGVVLPPPLPSWVTPRSKQGAPRA